MPTRRQLIQKITLNANASSVTFSNIPQNYTDLKLEFSPRGSTDVSSQISTDVYIEFNGSTSGYSRKSIYADFPSTTGSLSGSNIRGQMNLPISTSNTFSSNTAYIPNYNGSQNKTVSVLSMSETNSTTGPRIEKVAALWSNTSAINSIKFTTFTGSFVANSTFYLYGITHVPIIRGGEVSIANGYKIHTFKNTASLQVIEGGAVEYLVVAGGASGGHNTAGGGGAGGYRSSVGGELSGGGASAEPKLLLSAGTTYTVTVGAGGASIPTYGNGANGSNSVLSTITAIGGGGGSSPNQANAYSGGSGGGGVTGFPPGASGTSGQGYAGGSDNTGNYAAGGGGGAGGAGGNGSGTGTSATSGSGGSGVSSSITGLSVTRAGGGGGGAGTSGMAQNPGSGGTGGGGQGGGPTRGATDGVSNTGSGGGGARWVNLSGGNLQSGAGGSGIVIIRYPYDGN